MKPSFIGIGAQKCASTWIHDILKAHPDVSVPANDVKEMDFFSYRYENGFRWYESQFDPEKPVRGEISPSYFHDAGACERARAYEPSFKIIVSLRDPVERALSQHRHMVRLGLVPPDNLSFEAALESNPTYVEQGLYHQHLSRWIKAFGDAQVKVFLLEDIQRDGSRVARDVFAFLGADPDHDPPALLTKSNVSYITRSHGLERAVRSVRLAARAAGIAPLWQRLGDAGLRHAYHSINRRESASVIPDPCPETLERLRAAFRDDVARLGELLQRDLSGWLAA